MSTRDVKQNGWPLTRRRLLRHAGTGTAAVAATQLPPFNINHAWSQDVYYDGGAFDAGGATIRVAEWGGPWGELVHKYLLDAFTKDFNCNVEYDSSWPWFPKYVAGGPQNPPFDVTNWNLPEMFKTAGAGDFFADMDEIRANVPNTNDLWPFAYQTGIGVTWAFGQYGYAYRTDLVDPPPASFKDFWQDRFAGQRGTYITSNTLQMVFFVTASHVFGGDYQNMEAGFQAMRDAMPMKISDFTGNMQALMERGEVLIAVQNDAEPLQAQDRGAPFGFWYWTEKQPILTQTKTVSRYLEPAQKKLAYALLNRTLEPDFLVAMGKEFYLRPSNNKVVLPENLANKGIENTADATAGFWIPDWHWYLGNEDEIVETVNEIFAG
jgi:putative spermidine/putrescine transport system substrate-binding protein